MIKGVLTSLFTVQNDLQRGAKTIRTHAPSLRSVVLMESAERTAFDTRVTSALRVKWIALV